MANVKRPFMRSKSLGNVFKRKKEPAYQSWDEEDSSLLGAVSSESPQPPPREIVHFQKKETTDIAPQEDRIQFQPDDVRLGDCFYLGSYEMTGLTIRGRGCIDHPAGHIWHQTQEENQRRRKPSLPSALPLDTSFRPKYVRLVAGKDDLQVFDNYTNECLIDFSYHKISFVGTHPKHTRLFAYIAVAKGKRTPFCHAFKCEDQASATETANTLSKVFDTKVKELMTLKQQTQMIQVDVYSATVVN